ncbi:hypothetical protein SAMN05421855_10476 [Ulvibacter litoralis]|uniref:Uncharacterized protein n=1 Tax=Ulvibacter litoralis TaxID=227084 RepID=A0A1G7HGJ3_9FLAO|nr:hypothetical protein GCM10008083_22880 [Ulvibacter litoralis]SDE99414.1 hypothetical protein SAMN05421855_10476 [Ulvibacter litoralis]
MVTPELINLIDFDTWREIENLKKLKIIKILDGKCLTNTILNIKAISEFDKALISNVIYIKLVISLFYADRNCLFRAYNKS